MGRLVKARNVATGKDDEFVIEVVGLDGTRTELQVATAAEVISGSDTTKIVTANTALALTADQAQAQPGTLEKSKTVVLGSLGQLNWGSLTPDHAANVGRDQSWIRMGTWATPVNMVLASDHWVAIQVNLKNTGNVAFDVAAARLRVDTGGNSSNVAHGCLQLRQNIGHNVASSAILNASINISGAVTVSTGSVLGGYFSIEGTGAITKAGSNDCTPLVAVNNNTGGGVDNVIVAMQNGTGTTVSEIVKVISVHGTATIGLHVYATATDSVMTTGIKVSGGGQAMCGISIGEFASSYATGSALRFGASNTSIARFYGESVADLTSAVNARTVVARHLVVTSSATVAHETYGMIGQLAVKNTTLGHLHAGVMGTFEANTAATVNPAYLYGVAGVMARLGLGSGITVATTPVSGFSAVWNGAALSSGSAFAYSATSTTATTWTSLLAAHLCDNLLYVATASAYESGVKAGSITVDDATALAGVIRINIGGTPYYIPLFVAGDLSGE